MGPRSVALTFANMGRTVLRLVKLAAVSVSLAAASCGSAPRPPADPAEVAMQEQRLMSPFATERTVIADRLEVVLTANFYDELSRPAVVAGLQDEERTETEDGGSVVVYRNRSPGVPLRFMLGGTDFRIFREATITVLGGRSDLRLDAEMSGNVSIVEAGARSDYDAVRIADGMFQRRT